MPVRGCSTFWRGLAASFFCFFLGLSACFIWVFNEDEAVVSISIALLVLLSLSAFICGLVIGWSRKLFWRRAILAGMVLAGAIVAAEEALFPLGLFLQENLIIFLLAVLSSCVGALAGVNCSLSFQTIKRKQLPGA